MAEGNIPIPLLEFIKRTKRKTRQHQQIKAIDNITAMFCFVFGASIRCILSWRNLLFSFITLFKFLM